MFLDHSARTRGPDGRSTTLYVGSTTHGADLVLESITERFTIARTFMLLSLGTYQDLHRIWAGPSKDSHSLDCCHFRCVSMIFCFATTTNGSYPPSGDPWILPTNHGDHQYSSPIANVYNPTAIREIAAISLASTDVIFRNILSVLYSHSKQ
jgi:hypothetical protein